VKGGVRLDASHITVNLFSKLFIQFDAFSIPFVTKTMTFSIPFVTKKITFSIPFSKKNFLTVRKQAPGIC